MKKIGVAIVAALALAVLAFLFVANKKDGTPEAQTQSQTAPAQPSAPQLPATGALKITGVYSNDWLANCAPLSGAAQQTCTDALNSHYGKSDAAPVPDQKRPH